MGHLLQATQDMLAAVPTLASRSQSHVHQVRPRNAQVCREALSKHACNARPRPPAAQHVHILGSRCVLQEGHLQLTPTPRCFSSALNPPGWARHRLFSSS